MNLPIKASATWALAAIALSALSLPVQATDYSYQGIIKRESGYKLDKATLAKAKVQAQCLVGIKKLNFKRKDNFDPIAEWTSYRTSSLLEKYSPCEVLVMLEVVQKELRKELPKE
ncbi:MAG: hypothetical protein ACI8WB_002241 [Phenylobacterium sp.]|jgi:hypothetical protein